MSELSPSTDAGPNATDNAWPPMVNRALVLDGDVPVCTAVPWTLAEITIPFGMEADVPAVNVATALPAPSVYASAGARNSPAPGPPVIENSMGTLATD